MNDFKLTPRAVKMLDAILYLYDNNIITTEDITKIMLRLRDYIVCKHMEIFKDNEEEGNEDED